MRRDRGIWEDYWRGDEDYSSWCVLARKGMKKSEPAFRSDAEDRAALERYWPCENQSLSQSATIVSAYAFHHLGLNTKMRLSQHLALEVLLPGGCLVIADVAFRSARERRTARSPCFRLCTTGLHKRL